MATTLANLQTLAAAWGVGTNQTPIVVDLIKRSGLLQTAVVSKASHGIKHKYRTFNTLPTAVFREIGSGIVPQKIDVNWAEIALKEIAFDLFDDYQAIDQYPGGKDQWLIDNTPAVMAAIANAVAQAVYYGYDPTFGMSKAFKGFHQYAKDLGNVTKQAGGSTGSRNTIFAVRWDDLDGASLRVNNSELISVKDITPIQPTVMVTNTSTNEQLNIYKWLISSYFTLVVPSKKSVAAITQITSAAIPTASDMDALIDAVAAPSGNVFLYMNGTTKALINSLKGGKLNLFNGDNTYDQNLLAWGNTPIILDDNLSAVETTVLD